MINYAHRGASEYAPENTLSSFYLGLFCGANGIETDVHCTKDGVLVLFHDDTVDRVTNGSGNVSDFTWEELQKLTVFSRDRKYTDRIVSFEDFLRQFGWRNLQFAIELKQPEIERETIEMLEKYGMREKTILTSFTYENLVRAKECDPRYRVGWLYSTANENTVAKMREIGGEQLCPKASNITREQIAEYHAMGFSVRAWGVANEELMRRMVDDGADGMTVNFPDRLTAYWNEKNGGGWAAE